jgi:hypothetical protein
MSLDIYHYEHQYKIGNIISEGLSKTNPFKHVEKMPGIEDLQDSFFPEVQTDIQDRKSKATSLPQEFGELCKEYRQKYYNDIIPTII